MPSLVARRATQFEFAGDRMTCLLECRYVVEFEKFVAAAVGAVLVSGFDESFLAATRVAAAIGGVDWSISGVVHERSDERFGDEVRHDAVRNRCAVVELVAIAADMYDDLGVDIARAVGEQVLDCVCVLLRDARPVLAAGLRTRPHHPRGQEADQHASHERWQAQREQHHAVWFGAPLHRPLTMVMGGDVFGLAVAM